MNTPTQITDAAKKAEHDEFRYRNTGDYARGHFIQKLLDQQAAEYALMLHEQREKWEKKYNQAIEDICCQNAEAVEKDKQDRDQLRQQLTEAQQDDKTSFALFQQCQKELLKHKAAIAVKDEALNGVLGSASPHPLENPAMHAAWSKAHQALSPNCGQPLLELVREMREALNEASQFDEVYGKPTEGSNGRHIAYRLMIQRTEAALTKAAQLGF